SGAGRVGPRRAPILAQLVAGQQRIAPRIDDDVEIPVAQPVLVLRLVDGADGDLDAEAFEQRLVEKKYPFEERDVAQELDGERLAGLDVGKRLIADLVACRFEQ